MQSTSDELGRQFEELNQKLRNRANYSYEAFMGDYSMSSIEDSRLAVDAAKLEMEEFLTKNIGFEVKLGNRV